MWSINPAHIELQQISNNSGTGNTPSGTSFNFMLPGLQILVYFSPQIHTYLFFFGKESEDGADAQYIKMAWQH